MEMYMVLISRCFDMEGVTDDIVKALAKKKGLHWKTSGMDLSHLRKNNMITC